MAQAKPKTKRARKGKAKIRAVTAEVLETPSPGQPPLYRPEFCHLLENHLANGSSYETFVMKIPSNPNTSKHIHVDTLYNWEELYPEFSEAKARGNAARLDLFETAARNIALGLIPPPPLDQNKKPMGLMTRGNAAMAMFMLANLAPDKYRRPGARDGGDGGGGGGGSDDENARVPVINFNYNRLPEPKKKISGD